MKPEMYDLRAHAHIMGSSQLGKSKYVEGCCRDHAAIGNGFAVLDSHGTLDRNLKNHFVYAKPRRPVISIDPSGCQYIRPFNPFALPEGTKVSAHVARLADTILRAWGAGTSNLLPTYRRIVKMILTFCAVTGEPLHHAVRLLELPKKELREFAISVITDDRVKQQWKEFQYIRTFRDWKHEVESTQNRLDTFVGSESVRLFTGVKGIGTSVADWIKNRAIVLVNLQPSDHLSDESAKVFAALILSEFLHTALKNARTERPYFLYLDECQNYLTSDAAKMLDQVLKSGLRVSLIHHHLEQEAFLENPGLKPSIETNAKIKVIFGGLPAGEAKRYAEELFIHQVNERKEKERLYGFETEMLEEGYSTSTLSEHGHSTTSGTRYAPYQQKVTRQILEYTREERISFLAETLMKLPERHCVIKLPGQGAFEHEVELVEEYLLNPGRILKYEKALHAKSIPIHEAEISIDEEERRFFKRAEEYEDRGTRRPKKRPASLHPQE
jgi:hypothetical protein